MHHSNYGHKLDEELKSTVDEIIKECPRFRILVLGKSGAGKSSLINRTFTVDIATVSHQHAGDAEINREIISEKNSRFILHDSRGFEPGEVDNFATVRNFIQQRSQEPKLKDKLHAIWLCIEIPRAGGRAFEVGDEKLLNLDLGPVPIIVVFTKYDLLVRSVEMTLDEATLQTLDPDATEAYMEARVDEAFHTKCIVPLENACREYGGCVRPYSKVTIKDPITLEALIKTTQENISDVVWHIWAVAQTGSADVSVDASIDVGRKKYWRGLASSIDFSGKILEKCLDTIHKDITTVWNFHDPHLHLISIEFKALISNLVTDLVGQRPSNHPVSATIKTLAGAATVVAAAVPPAAPIIIPIAAAYIFAKWVRGVYQRTPHTLRLLMGYIVDLTIIMQSLFWLMRARGGTGPVRRRLVKLAFNAYHESADKAQVHEEIASFSEKTNFLNWGGKDEALNKVIDLIKSHRFDPTENYKLRAKAEVAVAEEEAEEAWE